MQQVFLCYVPDELQWLNEKKDKQRRTFIAYLHLNVKVAGGMCGLSAGEQQYIDKKVLQCI